MLEKRITIRRAVDEDVETARHLIAALGYTKLTADGFKRTFAETLHHQDTLIFIAEADGESALGLMTISHRPQLRLAGRIVSVDELVVSDSARGQGVGRALLDAAKSFAATVGATRLELHTNRARESYRRGFYIKNGFQEADSAVMRLEKDFGEG